MDYYYPRWKLFFDELQESLTTGKKFHQKSYNKKFVKKIGVPFTMSQKKYPIEPRSNTLKVVISIYLKWRKVFKFDNDYQDYLHWQIK